MLLPLPVGPTMARYSPVDTAKLSTMRVKGEELVGWWGEEGEEEGA